VRGDARFEEVQRREEIYSRALIGVIIQETDRQTDRQADRQTDRQTDTDRHRQTGRHTDTGARQLRVHPGRVLSVHHHNNKKTK